MKGRALLLFLSFVALVLSASVEAQNFSNPVRIPTGQDPYRVFAVDLNGDGLPDLLYEISSINSTPGTMRTFLAQASGGYLPGPTLSVPLGVGECYPADINGDGKQDLVCVEDLGNQSAQVAVFLGNGDGSFQTPFYSGFVQSDYADFSPYLYPPANLNTDSFPDLMISDANDPQTFVLLNDGTGHFNAVSTTLLVGGSDVPAWSVADLNGDGKPDLISSFGPLVYLGNGDGTFNAGKNYGSFDTCILHDMDGDGHLDAVCVTDLLQVHTYTGTNQLAILRGNADGSFNPTPIASETFGNPQGGNAAIESPVAVVDVNGDGIPDILGASEDGLTVLLGQPGLQFAAPVHYGVSNFGSLDGLLNYGGEGGTTSQVIDLNGDGIPDIVSVGPSALYISYGKKDGSFLAPPAYPIATTLGWMTVADFNGDGIPDIAATGDNEIELSLGKGDGTFQAPVALPNGGISFAGGVSITHGDFLGSGRQDLLATGSTGIYTNSYFLSNNGDGTFSSPQLVGGSFSSLQGVVVADFNGDHRDDLMITQTGPNPAVQVGISNGDGTFNAVTTALPNIGTGYVPSPAVSDFNKDGKLDLVYVAGANANVLKGNGDGTFNTNDLVLPIPPYQGQSLNYQPLAVATGDFDGDGNQDFAVLALVGPWMPPPNVYTNVATAVYIFYGNGDGTFSVPVIAATSTTVYDTIYTADVNQDGRTDLILENTGTEATGFPVPGNSVGVFLSEPDRLFGPETVFEAGLRGSASFVADVNRDGYPDLLVSNSSTWAGGHTTALSNSVTELLNLGPQTNPGLQASTTILTASSQSFVAGTSLTFTATVSGTASGGSTPTGSVRFADQMGNQSTAPLVASGIGSATATFTTSLIGPGTDTMSAAYSGDGTFGPSFATVPLTVSGLPDIVALSATPNPMASGSVATLSVVVSNPAGSTTPTPAGYIEFYDGSTVIGGPNTLSSGSTTFNESFSAPGAHRLSARYSGDSIHVSNSAALTETVEIQPTVSISAPASVTTAQVLSAVIAVSGGTGNPTPSGSVTLTVSPALGGSGNSLPPATLSSGSATINIPAGTLAAGTYWLSVTYTPDPASSSTYLSSSLNGDYITVTTPVVPYIQVNGGAWTQESTATVNLSATVNLGPHPVSGGTWSWTGPNGFSSTSRVLYGIPLMAGINAYTATYTNTAGGQSAQAFTITVNTPVVPYIEVNGGAWTQESTATVTTGAAVNLGPQPVSGGSWSWTGPNGFSSTARVLYGIPLTGGTNTYTATYTNAGEVQSTQAFTITVNTPVVPYIQVNGGAWTQESAATVNLTDTVNFGPQPVSGGTWSWTGPNGFSSTSRVLYGIPLAAGTNTFTATYTNAGEVQHPGLYYHRQHSDCSLHPGERRSVDAGIHGVRDRGSHGQSGSATGQRRHLEVGRTQRVLVHLASPL
ncbi:MAG: FG-GAP-like repeat-containing protein [Acidobacteriaceae bacterium]